MLTVRKLDCWSDLWLDYSFNEIESINRRTFIGIFCFLFSNLEEGFENLYYSNKLLQVLKYTRYPIYISSWELPIRPVESSRQLPQQGLYLAAFGIISLYRLCWLTSPPLYSPLYQYVRRRRPPSPTIIEAPPGCTVFPRSCSIFTYQLYRLRILLSSKWAHSTLDA